MEIKIETYENVLQDGDKWIIKSFGNVLKKPIYKDPGFMIPMGDAQIKEYSNYCI